jgi:hypothetical protein
MDGGATTFTRAPADHNVLDVPHLATFVGKLELDEYAAARNKRPLRIFNNYRPDVVARAAHLELQKRGKCGRKTARARRTCA